MIIKYKIDKYVKEERELEVVDTKNVFLQGTNPYDGLPTYFGIWVNENKLSIVTIISWRTISYKSYLNTNLSTKNDIQEYLKQNKNVKIIEKEEFKKQIQHIRSILEI